MPAIEHKIQPITPRQQQQVLAATQACIEQAGALFRKKFKPIPVYFDLRGRSAGMYRLRGGQRSIRYNPYLFAKYFEDNLATTVPHEVAHYVTDMLFGIRRIRPHGPEWQEVMQSLGVQPRATARYDLDGIPVRRQQRFPYRCGCTNFELTTCRHNKVRRGLAEYRCRKCGGSLRYTG